MKDITIRIPDMHCAACSSRVEKVLRETTGVNQANVNLATLNARVMYDDSIVSDEDLFEVIKKAGYTPERTDLAKTEKVTFNVEGMT